MGKDLEEKRREAARVEEAEAKAVAQRELRKKETEQKEKIAKEKEAQAERDEKEAKRKRDKAAEKVDKAQVKKKELQKKKANAEKQAKAAEKVKETAKKKEEAQNKVETKRKKEEELKTKATQKRLKAEEAAQKLAAKREAEKKEADAKAKAIAAEKATKAQAKAKADEEALKARLAAQEAAKKARERATKLAAQEEKAQKTKEKAQKLQAAKARARALAKKLAELARKAEAKLALAKEKAQKDRCKAKKEKQVKALRLDYPHKADVSTRDKWKNYGEHYANLAVFAKGDICQLEGRLRNEGIECNSKVCVVAKIDKRECRPDRMMHFSSNHGDKQLSISINTDGEIRIGSFKPKTWISLSGVTWTRARYSDKTSQKMDRKLIQPNTLANWAKSSSALVADKHKNLCILSGELSGLSWLKPGSSPARYVATLPKGCWPSSRLMFSTVVVPDIKTGESLRVDLHTNGKIEVIGVMSRALEPKISLDGIAYSVVAGTKLKLEAGLKPLEVKGDQQYAVPQAVVENCICVLQGAVEGNLESQKLATLPEWCRPDKTLTFNSPHNAHVMQLDVNAQGEVYLKKTGSASEDRSAKVGFVSLSSVIFPVPFATKLSDIESAAC